MSSPSRFIHEIRACLLLLLLLAGAGAGAAQERHNFLAVDNQIHEAAGPYYFVAHGDSSNAFARLSPFADALGLDVAFDDASKTLRLSNGRTTARLQTTSDVAAGLERRSDVFTVDGAPFDRAVPSGILVDGTSYVAVAPIAEAFGAEIGWHPDARVITVETDPAPAETELRALDQPRVGRHDGYTRVAIDLPSELEVDLAVGPEALALRVEGGRLPTLDETFEDGGLRRMYSEQTNGVASLVLVPEHAVDADGRGYRMGRTATGTVYLDLGNGLNGTAARAANVEPRGRPQRLGPAPGDAREQVVVIDAGHGGHDPGTTSPWATENQIVMPIAEQVRRRLEAQGVRVVMTRDDDTFLTLRERSNFATTERNLFVSIHANAAPNRSAQGIETWVFGRPLDPGLIDQAIRENGGGELGEALTQEAAESADIAGDILRESQLNYSMSLARSVQERMVSATGARDRGVRQNLFYVIRTARIPAILVEVGFVSNPDEGRRLTTSEYQSKLADALAQGITQFLRGGGQVAQR